MSLADSAIALTSGAWDSVHSDLWTILSGVLAGQKFNGEAQAESPLMLSSDLGEDAREKTMLFCWRPAPAIAQGIRISGKGFTWQVVDRDDNPVNARVKFELTKVTSRDT